LLRIKPDLYFFISTGDHPNALPWGALLALTLEPPKAFLAEDAVPPPPDPEVFAGALPLPMPMASPNRPMSWVE
jgi:hypothetical protein